MLGNQYFGDSFRGNLLLLDVRVRLLCFACRLLQASNCDCFFFHFDDVLWNFFKILPVLLLKSSFFFIVVYSLLNSKFTISQLQNFFILLICHLLFLIGCFGFILESDWLHEKCAIRAEIALLRVRFVLKSHSSITNQIAGNAIDFN